MAKLKLEIREAAGLRATLVNAAIASGPGSDGLIQLDLLSDMVSISYSEFDIPDGAGKPGEVVTVSAVPTFPPDAVKPIREIVARLKLTETGAKELFEVIKNHLDQLPKREAKTEA